MAPRIIKQLPYLNHLHSLKSPCARKKLLKTSSDAQIKTIRECILNVCNSNIKPTPCALKKLKRHKKVLLNIAGNNNRKARKLLIQRGGAVLPLILSTVLPALISYLRR